MVDSLTLAYLAQTGILLLGSLLLLYPVAAYARNVAYTEGVVALSASLLLLTVSYVLGALRVALWVRNGISLASAVAGLVGIWYFAQSFLTIEGEDPAVGTPPAEGGGFDGAEDD